MRRLGSLVMRAADATRVPAGAALAVDRERFSQAVTDAIARASADRGRSRGGHRDSRRPRDVSADHRDRSADVGRAVAGHRPLVGAEHLYFYDAISPIVLAESIDMSKVFRASRWGRSLRGDSGLGARRRRTSGAHQSDGLGPASAGTRLQMPGRAVEAGLRRRRWRGRLPELPDDTRTSTGAFYDALDLRRVGDRARLRQATQFFEGCLPIEVMAHRGRDTLRFGPMKPVGLADPRTGRMPYAVVQLRQDKLAGDHFSLVGFQTQLKWGDQARVLRMIPGLEQAEFVRFGMVHRNTYINGPTVLRETWQTRAREDLFFAGQISGVEGYVESAASGLLAGLNAARSALGEDAARGAAHDGHRRAGVLRVTCRGGALPADQHHLRHHAAARGPPARRRRAKAATRKKDQRKEAMAQRALQCARRLDGAGGDRGARVRKACRASVAPARGTARTRDRRRVTDARASAPSAITCAQSQCVRAHRPALRSDLVQFLYFLGASRARHAAQLEPADARAMPSARFLGDLHARGTAAPRPRAAVGTARLRALPASRGVDRGRPDGAGGGARREQQGARI